MAHLQVAWSATQGPVTEAASCSLPCGSMHLAKLPEGFLCDVNGFDLHHPGFLLLHLLH